LVKYLKKAWVTYCTLQANTTLPPQPSTRTPVPAINATLMVNDRDYIVVTLTLKTSAPTGMPHPPSKHMAYTPNWPSKLSPARHSDTEENRADVTQSLVEYSALKTSS
jgi:hypothetical protein